MFIDPLERQGYERTVLARRYPEAYNILIEQEQQRRRDEVRNPDALDYLIGRIKNCFRLKW